MTDHAIDIEHLVKRFGDFTAVNGISLKIKRGEIFGLLGPNGAGKSTTINMLLGLLRPTSGSVSVNGIDMLKEPDKAKKEIGIVTQETVVEPELTAEDNLKIFGRLYQIPSKELQKDIDAALKLADLEGFRKSYAGTFSGGMKRRLETAKALMHTPQIVLLDEPTTGLDVQNRAKIWELLKKINREKNVTILMTTQYLEEADQLCNRIGIIDHGKLIALGTPSELRQQIGMNTVLEAEVDQKLLPKAEQVFKKAGLQPRISGNKVFASVASHKVEKAEKILKLLAAEKIEVHNLSMHEPTIDDVFLKLTGTEVRDETEGFTSSRTAAMMKRGR